MEGLETVNRAEISQSCGSWSKVFFKLKKIRFYRGDSRHFVVPKLTRREKIPIWTRYTESRNWCHTVDCGTIAVRYARFWCRCRLWWGFRRFSFVFQRISSQLKTHARFWPKTNKKLDHKTHRRAPQRHQKRDPPDTQTNAPHSARRSGVLGVYLSLFRTF